MTERIKKRLVLALIVSLIMGLMTPYYEMSNSYASEYEDEEDVNEITSYGEEFNEESDRSASNEESRTDTLSSVIISSEKDDKESAEVLEEDDNPDEEASESESIEEVEESDDSIEDEENNDVITIGDTSILDNLDFSSRRLIVKGEKSVFTEMDPVIGNYGDVFLLQYDTQKEAKDAYIRLRQLTEAVEVDSVISIASDDFSNDVSNDDTEPEMTKEGIEELTNPFNELDEMTNKELGDSFDIAIIDTGAKNADKMVSVIGEDPMDYNGHGQRMVDSIKGIYPDAKILSIKAIGDDGNGDMSAVYAAIEYALIQNVKVINLSISALRTEDSFLVEEAIEKAIDKGIIVVGAAGNNGLPAKAFIPGGIEGVIVVGSCDSEGRPLSNSNYGDTVDVYAEGTGTSYSAAKVSGLIAKEGISILEAYENNTILFSMDAKGLEKEDMNMEEQEDEIDEKEESSETLRIILQGMTGSISINEKVYTLKEGENVIDGLKREEVKVRINTDSHITGYAIDGKVNKFGFNTEIIDLWGMLVSKEILVLSMPFVNGFGISSDYFSGTVTERYSQYDEGYSTFEIRADDTGEYMDAYCADNYEHQIPDLGASVSGYRLDNSDMLAKIAYYGYINGYWASSEYYGYIMSRALSRENVGNSSFQYNSEIDELISQASYEDVPDGFEVYYITDGTPQSIITMRGPSIGEIDLRKGYSSEYAEIIGKFSSYYDLTGAVYTVYNNAGLTGIEGYLTVGSTSYDGYQYTDTLEVEAGTYYVKETTPGKGYKLDPEVYEIYVGAGDFERITSIEEPETGEINLIKGSVNPEISNNNSCYNMMGIKYNVYATNEGTEKDPVLSDKVGELTIDSYNTSNSTGSSNSLTLPLGDFWIQEDKLTVIGTSFNWNPKAKKITVTADTIQTIEFIDEYGEIAEGSQVSMLLLKKDSDTNKNHPEGNASLSNAEFTVKYFDNYNGSGTPLRTWVFKTDDEGKIVFGDNSYFVSGDDLYSDINGEPAIPAGSITIKETASPIGYLVDDSEYLVTFIQGGDGTVHGDKLLSTSTKVIDNLDVSPMDKVIRGGVRIEKWDSALNRKESQGDASLSGIQFEIINKSKNAVLVDGKEYQPGEIVKMIVTNESGEAATGNDTLPFGSYEIRESDSNNMYRLVDGSVYSFEIEEDGKCVTKDRLGENLVFKNEVYSGDVKIEKWDKELDAKSPQGDGDLGGISFEIINKSAQSVYVEGKEYEPNQVVKTITTDEKGVAKTTGSILPYGTYDIKEVKSNAGYLLTDGNAKTFEIRQDNTEVSNDINGNELLFKNRIVRGGISIEKHDREKNKKESQGDADLAGIEFEITNKSKYAVLVDGVEYQPGKVVKTIATDKFGNAGTDQNLLPYGTYEIKEVKTNNKYRLTDGVPRTFTVREEGQLVIDTIEGNKMIFSNLVFRGGVRIEKWDLESNKKAPQGDGDFSGIQFEIVNASPQSVIVDNVEYKKGDVVYVLTTDAAGNAETKEDTLPYGTYTIQEVTSNDAYLLTDGALRSFEIREEGKMVVKDKKGQDLVFKDNVSRGAVRIEKWDAELDRQEYQGEAGFEGIKFELTNRCKYPVKVDGTWYAPGEVISNTVLVCDKEGNAKTPDRHLPYGTYEIKEVETNESYMLTDDKPRTFEIREDGEIVFKAKDKSHEGENLVFKNFPIKGGIKAGKIDRESDNNNPQGWGTLENAEFTIYSNNEKQVKINGVEYSRDEAIKALYSDKNGFIESENDLLPYGTYYIKETNAPIGYILNEEWRVDFQIREYKVIADTTTDAMKIEKGKPATTGWFSALGISDTNPAEVPDEIARLDMEFFKTDIDGEIMPFIPFLVSRVNKDGDIIEQHVIVSDEDGRVNTKERDKTGDKVNSLDKYVKGGKFTDESKLDPEVNIWFGDENYNKDNPGSLIYSQYKIEELQVEKNKGMDLLKTWLYADEDNNMITEIMGYFKHGDVRDLSNVFVNLIIHPQSDLIDDESKSKIATIGESIAVTDKFTYDHLKTDQNYKLLTEIFYEDRDGKVSKMGESMSDIWRPVKSDSNRTAKGYIYNTVEINTLGLEGGTINAVDTLYSEINGEYIELTKHNSNLDVESQKIYVPWMKTNAADIKTKDHIGAVDKVSEIVDKVKYENLGDKKVYLFVGELRDAESGELIKDIDGKDAVVEKVLRVSWEIDGMEEKSYGLIGPKDGEVEMPAFKINGRMYEGRTLVVTERLFDYDRDIEIIRHDSLMDEDQSVHYPRVRTKAIDNNTESHTAVVGKTVIKDEVIIENTIPGETYVVKGELRYQSDGVDANGNRFAKGHVIKSHEGVSIKATESITKVVLEFEVDAALLEGVSGVVFENLYHNDILVALHHDIEDESQTVNFPKVRTTAFDSETMGHTGIVGDNVNIIDSVSLSNLTVGDKYRVCGTLMTKDGKAFLVDGEPLVRETELFVAEEKNMTKELRFTFDSTNLAGDSLVVFEKLIHVIEAMGESGSTVKETEVARHEDLNDEGQRVDYPDIHTNATDSKTGDEVGTVGDKEIIVDKVSYKNLIIGETYKVEGNLHYKDESERHEKGELVLDENGEPYTASITFIPEEEDGFVNLVYHVNSQVLRGESIVVFEDLYSNGIRVISHSDINDDDQRIDYPEVRTTALSKKSGNHVGDSDEVSTIIDTVELVNLTVGKTYKVSGILMDKESGEPVLDINGKPIEAKTEEFLADKNNMTVNMEFKLDGSKRESKTTVVFEQLIHNDVVVSYHADIEDEAQSVYTPKIKTKAIDAETDDRIGRPREETIIIDTVYYENLIPGILYKVEGLLMDKKTGESYIDGDGKKVRSESQPFTVEKGKKSGTIDIKFVFNGTNLKGTTVVAFEDLIHNEVIVTAHHDINDDDQSVQYPDGKTEARDAKTNTKEMEIGKKTTIIDTVYYENLLPGKEYYLSGILMDKNTNKPLIANGKEVINSIKFTPKEKDGKIELEFVFDSSQLSDGKIVVFEDVKYKGIPVFSHKDINSAEQSIAIKTPEKPEIPNTPPRENVPKNRNIPETGDKESFLMSLLFLQVALLGLFSTIRLSIDE